MTAILKIDLQDVKNATDSVPIAIENACARRDSIASGEIGPTFTTSGPGPGWSIEYDETDYAERALKAGCSYYVSDTTGEAAFLDENGELTWTDDSVVELKCPEIEDAIDYPESAAAMAREVIAHHHPESNCRKWRELIESIRVAAEAFFDIDLDDLPTV